MGVVEEGGTGSIADGSGDVSEGVGALIVSDVVGPGVGTVGVAVSVGLGDCVGDGEGEDASVVLPDGSPDVGDVGLVVGVGIVTGEVADVVPAVLSPETGPSVTVNDVLEVPGEGQAVRTSWGTGAPVEASVVVVVATGEGGCALDGVGLCVAGARPPSTLVSVSLDVKEAVGEAAVTIAGRTPRSSTSASTAAIVSPIAVMTVSTSTGCALLGIDVLLRAAVLRPRRRHRHEALRP